MMQFLGGGDNGGAGMDYMGGVQTMGIVNAMKTGDLHIDMLIAMLIPLFLRFAFDLFNRINNNLNWENLCKWWKTHLFKYERTIVYKYFRDATLDLTTLGQQQTNDYYYNEDEDSDEDEDEKTMVGTLSKYKIIPKPKDGTWHVVGNFDGHEVQIMVTEYAEEEQSSGDTNTTTKSTTSTKTYHFVSPGKTSIDTFIQKAYDWYLDQLRSLEDHSRYLYEIRQTEKKQTDEGNDQGCLTYNRYKLSDEKTFDSLFFRQKKSLLTLIQHFQQKTGKYAIKGYPHKLGLLLYGEPGTGKTSLIKALAQHTGRSIVNIPLSKIETNGELMDIFFARRYSVDGHDVPVKLGFKDVIFVLEDVDASSKVVKRRVAEAAPRPVVVPKSPWQMLLESNDDETRQVVELLKEKSERLSDAAKESDVLFSLAQRIGAVPGLGVISCKEVDREIREEAIQMADSTMSALETVDRFVTLHAKTIKAMLESGAEISTAFEDALMGRVGSHETGIKNAFSFNSEQVAGEGDEAQQNMILQAALAMSTETNAASNSNAAAPGPSLFSKPKKDELNLSGLLNVLDGVVDTPGRIVIMTTNHPEQLDPALIRPGRIDKKIMLGFMNSLDMIEMVELYFQTILDKEQIDRIRRIAGALSLTPAEIEQMAAENDLVEELLSQLEDRAGLTVATSVTSSY